MEQKRGYFVVSLDFELYWGVFDKYTLKEYGAHILGERTAIPRMLELFKKYDVHATWAVVGMLMARSRAGLVSLFPPPELRPQYEDERASSYHYIETSHIGEGETDDQYHYGTSLVSLIQNAPNQEIANHTFSHYYCIDGQKNGPVSFTADLEAHRTIAATYGITTESIVFPRNQMNEEALRVCKEKGIHAYRGNENHFLYRPRKDSAQSLFVRGLRLIDHYVNLSGYHSYRLPEKSSDYPINIPSSRFLRPFMPHLSFLEPLRMWRIKSAMTYAAEHGEVFHLWWHPHNFGINQEENFKNLEEILRHYATLKNTFGMVSTSMSDIIKVVDGQSA